MLPSSSLFTTTTSKPAITALAGFVPWAEAGMRHTFRSWSPRLSCHFRMTSRPAYSPWLPALGCSDTAAKPVISASIRSSSRKSCRYPSVCSGGAKGCRREKPGNVTGIISAVAFSFIVQLPSGIIA